MKSNYREEFLDEIKNQAFERNWERSKGGGYWCEWCYFTNASRSYFQVDHLIAAANGGKPTLDNACILCEACNRSKGKHGWPRHGVGLAFRVPNLNMAPPSVRVEPLSWDDLVRMAQLKKPFTREG
jgi:hypothetical protein